MKNIMVLEDSMVNKIAAGEVVERPGSVAKELIENAIDAGATQITVETLEGGIGLIRVSDNGSGIPKDQVLTSFMRHATSKIRTIDDLEGVMTLGFRGEALSSIASVSQIEMITKTINQPMATRVEIHGGKLVEEQQIGAMEGTSIIMRNLFFNTPARRKFLKKPGTESSYISDIVYRNVLGHPEISFRYIVNNSEMLYTNGNGNLKNAIFAVYGKEIAKKLIEIDYQYDGLKVQGYIGKPELGRNNRSYGNIFINGRFIKSSIIENAVENGYKTKLLIGKFPVYVLNLQIKPNFVDVNVHPQKLEVRFSDEDKIYQLFYKAVQNALKTENLIPEYIAKSAGESDNSQFTNNIYQIENIPKIEYQFDNQPSYRPAFNLESNKTVNSNYSVDMETIVNSLFSTADNESYENGNNSLVEEFMPVHYDVHNSAIENRSISYKFFSNYRIIGQFFNTYWLVEQDEAIYIIDQHAAHERVIFDELMEGYKTNDIVSQRLVEPIILNLTDIETQMIKENGELFESFGFEIESFADTTFAVKSLPFLLRGPTTEGFFTEILDKLSAKGQNVKSIYEEKLDMVATISCKAAVKGHDKLSFQEAKALIEKLLSIENPFTCPHGRPTIIKLTKYEIEKMFKRIQ